MAEKQAFDSFEAAGIDTRGQWHGNVKTRCPRCDAEKRRGASDRPLSVNVDKGVWLCHRCGFCGYFTSKHWADDLQTPPKVYTKPDTACRFHRGGRGRPRVPRSDSASYGRDGSTPRA